MSLPLSARVLIRTLVGLTIFGAISAGAGTWLAIGAIARSRIALLLSAVAGFGMLIWIFVELALLRQYSWLQTLYFAHGCSELLLVLALLGLVPSLARPWPASERGAV